MHPCLHRLRWRHALHPHIGERKYIPHNTSPDLASPDLAKHNLHSLHIDRFHSLFHHHKWEEEDYIGKFLSYRWLLCLALRHLQLEKLRIGHSRPWGSKELRHRIDPSHSLAHRYKQEEEDYIGKFLSYRWLLDRALHLQQPEKLHIEHWPSLDLRELRHRIDPSHSLAHRYKQEEEDYIGKSLNYRWLLCLALRHLQLEKLHIGHSRPWGSKELRHHIDPYRSLVHRYKQEGAQHSDNPRYKLSIRLHSEPDQK